jgi:diguanylate cyclase (GGDEF)-like protein
VKYKSKTFVIPFIIITVFFSIISYFSIYGIENYYYSNMKEDSLKFAKSYSYSLSKSSKAHEVVNELLEDKVMVASRTVSLADEEYSNDMLGKMAEKLEVDEIDYYDSKGELLYSNIPGLVGWKAYEGHPVHDFMMGKQISSIDDIRQDVITGNYYKYGYFKVSADGFVQIGVKAEKMYDFLGSFEMLPLLNEMQDASVADEIFFIDNDFNIVGSTELGMIGQVISDKKIKEAIVESSEYGFVNDNEGIKKYEVFVPVYHEKGKMGTLVIEAPINETVAAIKKVTIIGIGALGIIYVLLFYMMIITYKNNKKLIRLAYYDPLTGLPNKKFLKTMLNKEIEKKDGIKKAIILINCKQFSLINLTYGYEYGDQLLVGLSRRIQEEVGYNNKLFRYSADRFVLYIKNYYGDNELISVSKKISKAFKDPIKVKGSMQHLLAQIGIAEINGKYNNFDSVFKDVSISLNYIRNNNVIIFFDEEMKRKTYREDLIEKELRMIIDGHDENSFYLEFQPQVDLKTNRVICFEALARLKSKSLGSVSPVEFIEVAERKQIIVPLGNLILKLACDFMTTLKEKGYGNLNVAVNISSIQLLRENFTNTVMDIIRESGINQSRIELEITESVILDNYELVNQKLKILRENNIRIALDDFGTGYSSFSRLRELNIDTVKIDRSFIVNLSIYKNKDLITGDIISMAHKLGAIVVAEGVELQSEKAYLIANNCDIMQGYLFSKPISGSSAIKLLKLNT